MLQGERADRRCPPPAASHKLITLEFMGRGSRAAGEKKIFVGVPAGADQLKMFTRHLY